MRVDTGVREGDAVTVHYDPMIAKLVVWDETRDAALRRLRSALAAYQVVGVSTNIGFLQAIASHPVFAAGEVDTGFIERHGALLSPAAEPVPDTVLAVAALSVMVERAREVERVARRSGDPFSPWHAAAGWRLNDDNHHDLAFRDGDRRVAVTVHYRAEGWLLDLPERRVAAKAEAEGDGRLAVELDGTRRGATVVRVGEELNLFVDGRAWRLLLDDPAARAAAHEMAGGGLTAPMPGKVVQVIATRGAVVERGAPLLILEAMKMEHTIKAPANGTVREIHFRAGDQVPEGAELLEFEVAED